MDIHVELIDIDINSKGVRVFWIIANLQTTSLINQDFLLIFIDETIFNILRPTLTTYNVYLFTFILFIE